jgi:hypothetical protein
VVLSKAYGATAGRVLVVLLEESELPAALQAAPTVDAGGDVNEVARRIADLVRARVP